MICIEAEKVARQEDWRYTKKYYIILKFYVQPQNVLSSASLLREQSRKIIDESRRLSRKAQLCSEQEKQAQDLKARDLILNDHDYVLTSGSSLSPLPAHVTMSLNSSMWKHARERERLQEQSRKILDESRRLSRIAHLSSEQEEQAMSLIETAQGLKARKLIWNDHEDKIKNLGGPGCLCCASCRYQFSSYSGWKKHICKLSLSIKAGNPIYRVLSVQEEKEFKEATNFLTPSIVIKICIAVKVCVPGVFPLIFLPRSRWSPATLGWLGKEVGCTKNSRNIWTEIQDNGIQMPQIITVKTRDGSVLEIPSLLLSPYDSHDQEDDTGTLSDSDMLCDSDEESKMSMNSSEEGEGEVEPDDWESYLPPIPTKDPTISGDSSVDQSLPASDPLRLRGGDSGDSENENNINQLHLQLLQRSWPFLHWQWMAAVTTCYFNWVTYFPLRTTN